MGSESRRVDLAGLAPSQAWRSVGLDLQAWPAGPAAPIVLRGVELSTDPLAHDLATSPDLDAKVAAQPRRGLFLTIDPDTADPGVGLPPLTPEQREATRTGELDDVRARVDGTTATRVACSGETRHRGPVDPAAGRRRRRRRAAGTRPGGPRCPVGHPRGAGHRRPRGAAAQVRHGAPRLPAWDSQPALAGGDQKDQGVAVRTLGDPTQTFLEIANDTPYPIRLAGVLDAPASAAVEDLGRNLRLVPQAVAGGRQLVIDLLPFGVSAIRVGAPKIQLTEITPYPSEAVLTSMEAQYRELSNQLARLNRGSGSGVGEPANPGFEPETDAPVQQAENSAGECGPRQSPPARSQGAGRSTGAAGGKIAIDAANPHSGQGSLKLTAPAGPVSVISGDFVPSSASSMTIQAYLRAEPADSRCGSGSRAKSAVSPTSAAPSSRSARPGSSRRSARPTCRRAGWTRPGCGSRC